MTDLIAASVLYTNMVLSAILPQVSDFAARIELPVSISMPIKQESIERFVCRPFENNPAGYIFLKNDCKFWYRFGHVEGFSGPKSYYRLQDPAKASEFRGKINLTGEEAVTLARNTLIRLGYQLREIFADRSPIVTPPPIIYGNPIPVYRIEWHSPLEISSIQTAIDIEIDAHNKCIQSIKLAGRCFYRDPLDITFPFEFTAQENSDTFAQSNSVVQDALPKISNYVAALHLPMETRLSSKDVEGLMEVPESGFLLKFKNHFRFWYQAKQITAFSSPDSVFVTEPGVRQHPIDDYLGQWKMSEKDAVGLVYDCLRCVGYSSDNLIGDTKMNISKPTQVEGYVVPRFELDWVRNGKRVSAEVDCDKGTLKSLYVGGLNPLNDVTSKSKPISQSRDKPVKSILSGSHTPSLEEKALLKDVPGLVAFPFFEKSSLAAKFVARAMMLRQVNVMASRLHLPLHFPIADADLSVANIELLPSYPSFCGVLNVGRYSFMFSGTEKLYCIRDSEWWGKRRTSARAFRGEPGLTVDTNSALRIATNCLREMCVDLTALQKKELTLTEYDSFDQSLPVCTGVTTDGVLEFNVVWKSLEGPRAAVIIDGETKNILLIGIYQDSLLRTPLLVKGLNQLLSILDDEFLKYSEKQRNELVSRFANIK